ncbi:MAG: hypothetical protein V3V31_13950 [Methylococcales bacterium]
MIEKSDPKWVLLAKVLYSWKVSRLSRRKQKVQPILENLFCRYI